jgi:lantibiotic biosynthesis protein
VVIIKAISMSPGSASPGTVLPDGYQRDGCRWSQSLVGGAAGIALLHVERARSGHGDWVTARSWLAGAASGSTTAASNARLFFGVPALAFLFHIAVEPTGHYRGTLGAQDDATGSVTHAALDAAHAHVDRRDLNSGSSTSSGARSAAVPTTWPRTPATR